MNPPPSPPTPPAASSASLSSGAATEALLALGLKPVARELHDVEGVEEARRRWQAMGYVTAVGEPVIEDLDTAAMVVDVKQVHTTRHLATHPVIARLVTVFGRLAEHLFLDPSSRVHQWLAERLDAERTPHQGPLPTGERTQERRAVYVSQDLDLAERAKALDRMAEASRETDGAVELGALLGYPPCCVKAFSALPRRWPNRFPIEAAMARTEHFEPRLNNVALDRFAWIAWFPCRYDCAASLTLADAAARAMAAEQPGPVSDADRLLARPRLYIDDSQQAELVGAQGTATEMTFEQLRPLKRRGQNDPPIWRSVSEANSLVFRGGAVQLFRDGEPLRWEGDAILLPFGVA
ncbi:MAG: hypothetical protein ACPGU1_05650 [Myxococcota bacterium]